MALTESGGSIDFTRDERGYWNGRVEKWDKAAEAKSGIPAVGTAYGGEDPWAAAKLRSVNYREAVNGERGILVLNYSSVPVTGTVDGNPSETAADGVPVYRMDVQRDEVPISRHPNYKVIWDHHLYGFAESSPPPIGDVNTITDISVYPVGYEDDGLLWVHVNGYVEIEDGEGRERVIMHEATKPHVTGFPQSYPVVQSTAWFDAPDDAGDFATSLEGTLAAPDETFNLPDGAAHWLIASGPVQPDGKRWQAERLYYYSRIPWDTDIYPVPLPAP